MMVMVIVKVVLLKNNGLRLSFGLIKLLVMSATALIHTCL